MGEDDSYAVEDETGERLATFSYRGDQEDHYNLWDKARNALDDTWE